MQLRYYQQEAINACYQHLTERDDNPCIVIPTGGGKTPVLATMCVDVCKAGGRVLVVTHVKELIEQTANHLNEIEPSLIYGIYSASLNYRCTKEPVIIAGIQSIYKRAQEMGSFDLIVVDEAHLIPPDGDGMYQQFLRETRLMNPKTRLVGLTATPYRMKGGWICKPENLLNQVCYEAGIKELINEGFLSPLISKSGIEHADLDKVHTVAGDYNQIELAEAMSVDKLVDAAVQEIISLTKKRNSVLIFAAGVDHGRQIQKAFKKLGEKCRFVCGESPPKVRQNAIIEFKDKEIKYLSNAKLFTTGFDAPNVDCIVLLTSTLSTGLYYQMVGRGLRIADGKENCLVLDYGNNIVRHGPIDCLYVPDKKPKKKGNQGNTFGGKECPKCQEIVSTKCQVCIRCGYEFPPKHDDTASEADILSKVVEIDYEVQDVHYTVHIKRDASDDAPRTMRVDYVVGWGQTVSEWVCVEHTGFAYGKAKDWWQARTDIEMPKDADKAVEKASEGFLLEPKKITVLESPSDFPKIVNYEMDEMLQSPVSNANKPEQPEIPFIDDIPF